MRTRSDCGIIGEKLLNEGSDQGTEVAVPCLGAPEDEADGPEEAVAVAVDLAQPEVAVRALEDPARHFND